MRHFSQDISTRAVGVQEEEVIVCLVSGRRPFLLASHCKGPYCADGRL